MRVVMLLVILLGAATAGESQVVAMMPIATRDVTTADIQTAVACEEALLAGIASGGLIPVERRRIADLITELSLPARGLVEASDAPRLGRLVGASTMMLSSLRRDHERLTLICRGVACSDGSVVWAGQATGGAKDILAQCPRLTADLAANLATATSGGIETTDGDMAQTAAMERVIALEGQGLNDEAVGEAARILVRKQGPKEEDVKRLLDALALAGLADLALAEAKVRGLPWKPPSAAPAPIPVVAAGEVSESAEARARRVIAQRLDAIPGDACQLLRDRANAWMDLARRCLVEGRSRATKLAMVQAYQRLFVLASRYPGEIGGYQPIKYRGSYQGVWLPPMGLDPQSRLAATFLHMRGQETEIWAGSDWIKGLADVVAAALAAPGPLPDIGPPPRMYEIAVKSLTPQAADELVCIFDPKGLPSGSDLLRVALILTTTRAFNEQAGTWTFAPVGPEGKEWRRRMLEGSPSAGDLAALLKDGATEIAVTITSRKPVVPQNPQAYHLFFYFSPRGGDAGGQPSVSALIEELVAAILSGDAARAGKLAADPGLAAFADNGEFKRLLALGRKGGP